MPFVSPDSQWIGFGDGTALTKVAATGGPGVVLAALDGAGRGGTWGPDDAIIFATSNPSTGLQRVDADGGPVTVLTRPDHTQGEADHLYPELLPGGRALLFTITSTTGGVDAAQVAVLDLETGTRTILVRGGSHARYVTSGPGSQTSAERDVGHLVYEVLDTLRAVAFDPTRLETRGANVAVVSGVARNAGSGILHAVVAGDGTLAYVQEGHSGALAPRTLVWVDRQGRETPIPAPGRRYVYPRLSPDGSRIAVVSIDQEIDVWIWNFNRTTLTRSTLYSGADHSPLWMPDGIELIFSSERDGARNLFKQRADGTGVVERLTESANIQYASAVSSDGRRAIFTQTTPKTGQDVMQIELDGSHRVTPLIQSVSAERNGVISPDGRWLAYESNASGPFEVWVRPFPDVNSGQSQVSTAGGTRPRWTRSGQELVYVSPGGALMRVGVVRGESWSATPPTRLIKEGYGTTPPVDFGITYDVSPDGERFLLIKEARGSEESVPVSVIVVLNWTEELKQRVPTR
jgi:serine/threonine-protein kinase